MQTPRNAHIHKKEDHVGVQDSLLVVDDEEGVVRLIQRTLQKAGFQTTRASSGAEAITRIAETRPTLMLLDYQLPDMIGKEVIETLMEQGNPVPFIIVTGRGDEQVAVEMMKLGALDYLVKDANFLDLLVPVVSQVIDKLATEQKLAEAEKELERYHLHLEQLVEERTTELSRANAELLRSGRLKDEFLAMMSHELRTPLNSVLGMTEALREEVNGALNERQLKWVHTIEASGRHLLEIINDILELSALSTGKITLECDDVGARPLCQSSVHRIKPSAQQKHLSVSFTFDGAVTTVYADGHRLKRVLVKLLNNAVKFTPEKGNVGLDVHADPEESMVHFTVWDSGIGMAKDEIERLFQPFIQLDSSLSRPYGGIGLGLTLAYRIIDLHGGSIAVESEPGTGSRFTISLPRQGTSGESRISDSGSLIKAPEHKNATILIVEDNERNLDVFSAYLQDKGYQIMTARSGEEALEQITETRPDLMVMDLHMPGIGGLEAIRRIRADATLKAIPIIAVTALVIPEDRERCLAAGADGYMSKPVKLRALADTLATLLKKGEE